MLNSFMKFRGISITLRLTLMFASLATAVLLVLGLLIGNSVENHFIEQDMELMNGKLDLAAHLLEKIQTQTELDALPQVLDDTLVGHHSLSMLVALPDQRPLFSSGDAQFPPTLTDRPVAAKKPLPQSWLQDSPDGQQPLRGVSALLPTAIAGMPPLLVAVALDISHHDHFMASFRKTLWLFISIAVLIVSLLGWAMVRQGLAPLQAIRQGAAGVTANRLDYRLQLDSVPVELAQLADTLNNMLARLEESFQRLKDFSSDLAHELRTPISNLMTQTQVVLTRTRSADEYREVLASNAEEYERLAKMIGDMLFLAQADNGLLILHREPIELAKEIRELFDFFDALAEEKQLRLVLSGAAQVSGDKLMLRRALANLLSNAIRHASNASEIQVTLNSVSANASNSGSADGVTLTISNQGDAIAAAHLPHIFERFYRTDPSRHSNGEGAGLGLAITRSIIRAHGGEISATSAQDGVSFEIVLKAF
jgi:two-component system heavy metal sensor histidine kinase CusS